MQHIRTYLLYIEYTQKHILLSGMAGHITGGSRKGKRVAVLEGFEQGPGNLNHNNTIDICVFVR